MQDNQSATLLQNNGRFSAGKGTWHIDIQYFFISDQINKKHIKVEYCPPTLEMIADFFTKPLQGALFHKFRNAVLGIGECDFAKYELEYLIALEKYNLLEPADTIRLHRSVLSAIKITNDIRTEKRSKTIRPLAAS